MPSPFASFAQVVGQIGTLFFVANFLLYIATSLPRAGRLARSNKTLSYQVGMPFSERLVQTHTEDSMASSVPCILAITRHNSTSRHVEEKPLHRKGLSSFSRFLMSINGGYPNACTYAYNSIFDDIS